jgi:hypothetical protein
MPPPYPTRADRQPKEYDSLLREADLRLNKVAPTGSQMSVIEPCPDSVGERAAA